MNHIFYDIFEKLPRVGPGDHRNTMRALNTVKSKINLAEPWHVLDVGCGTGVHTVQLAQAITGNITALDSHPAFLESLKNRVNEENLTERIECIQGDMAAMDFEPASFDLIWAEGSIFIMGLEAGLTSWKHFLKPGGFIALTDAFLFTRDIPEELKSFWEMLGLNLANGLWVWQIARGLLWVLIAWPVLAAVRGGFPRSGVILGVLFAVLMNAQHLIPNPYMPGIIPLAHGIETASSNFIWGMAIGWLLDPLIRISKPRNTRK